MLGVIMPSTQIKKVKMDTQLKIKLQLETNLNNILSTNIYVSFIDKIYWEKERKFALCLQVGERERNNITVMLFVFRDQVGQFWNVLNLIGIDPNLKEVNEIYPKKKKKACYTSYITYWILH